MLLCVNPLLADHILGADFTYSCLGGKRYLFELRVYRNCGGSVARTTLPLSVLSYTSCASFNANLTRTAIKEVSVLCKGMPSKCNPVNTTVRGSNGVEEHTYQLIIDFSLEPWKSRINAGCCQTVFHVTTSARNTNITTGQRGSGINVSAMLDLCNISESCNNSPKFNTNPVAYLCCNLPFYYNNDVKEIDGDLIRYELVPAMARVASITPYLTPFTYQNPMTSFCPIPTTPPCEPLPFATPPVGFFLDTLKGDLIFTPINCTESGIVAIRVNEYRFDLVTLKYKLIGYVTRDIQLIVTNCAPNNPPEILSPSFDYTVCEGDRLCMRIQGKDLQARPYQLDPDTVFMQWNEGITNATWTILNPDDREKEAEFCWQTMAGQANPIPYTFTVSATDRVCPIATTTIRSFHIKVLKKSRFTHSISTFGCRNLSFQAKALGQFDTSSIQWTFTDIASNELIFPPYSGLGDTLIFPRGGNFHVRFKYSANGYCDYVFDDTVYIRPDPDIAVNIQGMQSCAPLETQLNSQSQYPHPEDLIYAWNIGEIHSSDKAQPGLLVLSEYGSYRVKLRITDSTGPCSAEVVLPDSLKVFANPTASFTLNPAMAVVSIPRFRFHNQSSIPDSTILEYYWTFNFRAPLSSRQEHIEQLFRVDTGNYLADLVVVSKHGCRDSMTKPFRIAQDMTLYIPNAFSPDAGGPTLNNRFYISGNSIQSARLHIYNRWGEKLFETTDFRQGWDGTYKNTLCPEGVYTYYVEAVSFTGELFHYRGSFHLIH